MLFEVFRHRAKASHLLAPQGKSPTGGTRWGVPSDEICINSRLTEIVYASPSWFTRLGELVVVDFSATEVRKILTKKTPPANLRVGWGASCL